MLWPQEWVGQGPAWPHGAAPVVGTWEIVVNTPRSGSFNPRNHPSWENSILIPTLQMGKPGAQENYSSPRITGLVGRWAGTRAQLGLDSQHKFFTTLPS